MKYLVWVEVLLRPRTALHFAMFAQAHAGVYAKALQRACRDVGLLGQAVFRNGAFVANKAERAAISRAGTVDELRWPGIVPICE